MKRHQALICGAFTMALTGAALAAGAPSAESDAKLARAGFEKLTKAKAMSSATSPIPGLYEVVVDGQIVYTDKSGRFLIQGNIIDLEANKNVTEERLSELNRVDLAKLPMADAIKVVKGNGARILVTFEDPNCGFCKRLAPELEKLTDVTVYTFPVGILGPDSLVKAQSIVCSQEPAKQWADAMAGRLGSYSVDGACKAAAGVERNTKLMTRLGIRGTPGILFADGSRLPGYAAAEVIESRLRGASVK